ncbi:probable ATP-dependent RNA helicase DDX60 [Eurytemora carolleeae]|uniref:probable ATP-dependent RNA helicase DDX60 n=1 Tax=Eurytemora carolleeae TaxID=1294199 RepID=UPI000C756E95|nr:probable ATP-dependent RNA helicase DDX60 [Eurytemora carolleeae]|eukprot:XP_023336738.1 probable ATP-dependent RNA helicase DDX60 [Eurytemora affinis]
MEEDKLEVPRIPNPIVNPNYMDICWEFADSEIFLVDAQALIQLLHEENKETIQDFGVNSLHLVYLIERFLHAFKDRGGDFTLVFFSDKRLRTNPLLTDILIHHFKMNTSVSVITEFSSPFDLEFETYVLKESEYF